MNEHDADSVLAGLDPQQREVAANPLGPMVVLAGAGTGVEALRVAALALLERGGDPDLE